MGNVTLIHQTGIINQIIFLYLGTMTIKYIHSLICLHCTTSPYGASPPSLCTHHPDFTSRFFLFTGAPFPLSRLLLWITAFVPCASSRQCFVLHNHSKCGPCSSWLLEHVQDVAWLCVPGMISIPEGDVIPITADPAPASLCTFLQDWCHPDAGFWA